MKNKKIYYFLQDNEAGNNLNNFDNLNQDFNNQSYLSDDESSAVVSNRNEV